MENAQGQPTAAVYGFISMLARLIKEEKPTHIAAVFDHKGKIKRQMEYPEYKATRKPMPEELVATALDIPTAPRYGHKDFEQGRI